MKIYIAGKICEKYELEQLEKVDNLCKNLGFDTFLPHRDVGIAKGMKDVERIFQGDIINGFKNVSLVIALLDGLHVGAGTAWELGYAYANKIPVIGLKTDESIEDCLDQLSAILIGSMKIVSSFEELEGELKNFKLKNGKKIKTIEEINDLLNEFRKENKMIVTTNGSFDILHYAHVNLLEKAKKQGDILIVLLNSDYSIKRIKGEKRPIISENERACMLAALECVDYVVIFNEEDPLKLIKQLKPNIHVKGGTFIPEKVKEEKEIIESLGGKHIIFEIEEGFSTTNIIEKIILLYT